MSLKSTKLKVHYSPTCCDALTRQSEQPKSFASLKFSTTHAQGDVDISRFRQCEKRPSHIKQIPMRETPITKYPPPKQFLACRFPSHSFPFLFPLPLSSYCTRVSSSSRKLTWTTRPKLPTILCNGDSTIPGRRNCLTSLQFLLTFWFLPSLLLSQILKTHSKWPLNRKNFPSSMMCLSTFSQLLRKRWNKRATTATTASPSSIGSRWNSS